MHTKSWRALVRSIFAPCGAGAAAKRRARRRRRQQDGDGSSGNPEVTTGFHHDENQRLHTGTHSSTERRVPVWSLRWPSSSSSSSVNGGGGSGHGGNLDGTKKQKSLLDLARFKFHSRTGKGSGKQLGDMKGPLLLHLEEDSTAHSFRVYYSGGADVKAKAERLAACSGHSLVAVSPRPH